MPARKFIALMASGIALLFCTVPDLTLLTMHEQLIGQTAFASDIVYGKVFTIGKGAFAVNFPFVETDQPLLEFVIIFTVCDVNGTDSAIKAARRKKIRINLHKYQPPLMKSNKCI
jgi:hypothetical protein